MSVQALKQKRVWVPVAVLLSFGIGVGAGSGGADSTPKTVTVEKRVEVPGPERIVTKDVPGPERVVTVTKTPASCITALDLAGDFLGSLGKQLGYVLQLDEAKTTAEENRITKLFETEYAKGQAMNGPISVATTACRASK